MPTQKKNAICAIAVVCGGNTGEYEVSLNSANMVLQCLDKTLFRGYKIIIKGADWYYEKTPKQNFQVDKNDFSITVTGKKITFDCVYNIVHGDPGENGKLAGYFAMLNIPCTSPPVLESALTMHKSYTKALAATAGLAVPKSKTVKQKLNQSAIEKILTKLQLPVFVKPNAGGSSLATYKCKTIKEIAHAIKEGLKIDDTVLIEEYINGKELTCGVYLKTGLPYALPVTEIIPHTEFFDYAAKYLGKSDEITPADIPEIRYKQVQQQAIHIYKYFNLSALVRVDFILTIQHLYFMELNTIPGFSKPSIVPQQIRAAGLTEKDVITQIIEGTIKKKQ